MIEKEPQKSVYEKPKASKQAELADTSTIKSQSMMNSKYESQLQDDLEPY